MAEAADFQGTSPSPARRWLRRTGALLAGAPLLGRAAPVPAAPRARRTAGRRRGSAHGRRRHRLADAPAPRPTSDTLTVSGTVTNNGKQTVTDAHVGLRVGPTLEQPQRHRQRRPAHRLRAGRRRHGGRRQVHRRSSPSSTPGVSRSPSRLSVPVERAGSRRGRGLPARRLALRPDPRAARTTRCSASSGPSCPGSRTTPTRRPRLTYLWPLISTAHLTARDRVRRAADAGLPRRRPRRGARPGRPAPADGRRWARTSPSPGSSTPTCWPPSTR